MKTIKSTVLDTEMRFLDNANVQEVNVVGAVFGSTKTDKNGQFQLPLQQTNTFVKISHVGYKTQILDQNDKVFKGYVSMKDDSTELVEVVVSRPKTKKSNSLLWLLVAGLGVGLAYSFWPKASARKVTI